MKEEYEYTTVLAQDTTLKGAKRIFDAETKKLARRGFKVVAFESGIFGNGLWFYKGSFRRLRKGR